MNMKNKLKIKPVVYPNFLTTLNVFSGFISILLASEGEITLSIIFILLAALFDVSDGFSARMFKSSSDFGVQLDSLSDVVSFGVAPSFILYKIYFYQFGIAGMALSSLLLVFGALRLARFNITVESPEKKTDFKGLPIPFSALTVSAYVLTYFDGVQLKHPFDYYVLPMTLLFAILMVSNIRFISFGTAAKMFNKRKWLFVILALALIASIILSAGKSIFYILLSFIIYFIINHIYFIIISEAHEKKLKVNEGIK